MRHETGRLWNDGIGRNRGCDTKTRIVVKIIGNIIAPRRAFDRRITIAPRAATHDVILLKARFEKFPKITGLIVGSVAARTKSIGTRIRQFTIFGPEIIIVCRIDPSGWIDRIGIEIRTLSRRGFSADRRGLLRQRIDKDPQPCLNLYA